ncbi:hypothetical protein FOXB_00197 [Fusarium oxysporum f. sp. conglutinans Fo5176]|uniref:Calcium-transporting ATPase n=1 Tax=Fusarium oxysporum (strain Fo5176) TaxID=660025 RepID=F9F1B1_FUSOF|nr:hypothetical protein FOXB_00197 [Fusarium oxysporum f. sp. conglutinans Fo5176]
MENAFAKPVGDVLANFNVNEATGLSDSQVTELRNKHGRNSIPEEPPTPLWELILEQFKDQLVLILLGSAAVSFILALFDDEEGWSAFVDPVVILTILILNGVVGVSQESSAEKAIAALQEYSANEANVVRNGGHVSRVKAEELVPGDIVTVSIGDRIPADCRVISIESNSFSVDQAVLTGESESVGKRASTVIEDEKAVLQDQTNMLFSGTTVVTGRARAIVVLTGPNTAIGDIHESITAQISEPTPLKQKLNDFGDSLAKVITVICILVWLINIPNFNDPSHGNWTKGAIYYLKIAVSLGVAAIPEGLAVVITTCLALGTRKMAAKNAVVRSLPSVETLGSCSVICSDKTGTLTTNQMSVSKVLHLNEDGSGLNELDVEGTTFAPRGAIKSNGVVVQDLPNSSATIRQMTQVAAICNDAQLAYDSRSATFSSIGEPTEGALRVLVEKIGPCAPTDTRPEDCVHYASAAYQKELPRLATYEFSRDRKSMSVLVGKGNDKKLLVKGAPESVIDRCTQTLVGSNGKKVALTKKIADRLMSEIVRYGNNGLRVIALASIDKVAENPLLHTASSTEQYAQLEQNMTFLGLVCMLDPPREEVPGAVQKCKDAGIRVIVITGDNRNTAESICRQIGVFGQHEDLTGKSYTGREFDQLSPSEQLEAAKRASLFSRVEPSHKSRLVDLLQSLGEVVAMTGDGVNDAPALKKADIGVAMGSGTDVSKLAADMVLADSNFATIEVAIEEGRSIYNNTQQFIRYLISSNIGSRSSSTSLGQPRHRWSACHRSVFQPPDHDIMKRRPRKRDEALIGGWLFFRYLVIGTYVGLATVAGYAWWFMYNPEGPQITFRQLTRFHHCSADFPEIGCSMFSNDMAKAASTVSLSILVVIEMFNAINALSSSESLLTLPLWKNMMLVYAIALSMALHFALVYIPFLQGLFSIVPLNVLEWKAVVAISAPVVLLDEILKAIERQFFMQTTTDISLKTKKEQ